jgi:hypothetical protein
MSVTCPRSPARATLLAAALCLLASGCTTLKAVQEVGKQAADGNLITAAYTATIGVAVAAIVDVVTLGGVVSPEEGMGLITAAAAASNGTPPPVMPSASSASSASSARPATAAGPASVASSTSTRPAAGAGGMAAAAPARPAAGAGDAGRTLTLGARPDMAASHCIRVLPPRSRQGWFRIDNSCDHPVEVAYCATSRQHTNSLCRLRVNREQAGEIAAYHHARLIVGARSGKDLPVEADADAVYAGACRTSFGDSITPHLTGVAPLTGATLVRCIGPVGPRDAPVVSAGTR